MIRVSTAYSQQSALLNIQQGQVRQNTALQQVSTGKIGDNLKDFAYRAETLIASRNVQVRTETYIANGAALGAKLKSQDQALGRVSQGADAAVAAVTKALANNDGGQFMVELQAAMDQAVSGLNTSYSGGYLFSGGAADTPPVALTKLSDLDTPPPPPPAAAPARPAPFANGALAAVSRLDDDTVITTGVLADNVAGELFDGLADVAAFPSTNFGAPLTTEQHDFLNGLLTKLTAAAAKVTNAQAHNGALQKQVEDNVTDLKDRKDMVRILIGDITEVDPLEAAARLDMTKTVLAASAKAYLTLQGSSLLDLLSR